MNRKIFAFARHLAYACRYLAYECVGCDTQIENARTVSSPLGIYWRRERCHDVPAALLCRRASRRGQTGRQPNKLAFHVALHRVWATSGRTTIQYQHHQQQRQNVSTPVRVARRKVRTFFVLHDTICRASVVQCTWCSITWRHIISIISGNIDNTSAAIAVASKNNTNNNMYFKHRPPEIVWRNRGPHHLPRSRCTVSYEMPSRLPFAQYTIYPSHWSTPYYYVAVVVPQQAQTTPPIGFRLNPEKSK